MSGAWRTILAGVAAFGVAGAASYGAASPRAPRLAPPPPPSLTVDAAPALRWSPAARDLLAARCGACHAPDLIVAQRLSREDWAAEIAKMRRWGARLSDGEAADLTLDLAEQLGVAAADVPRGRIDPREVDDHDAPQAAPWPPGSVERGAALFQEACAPCHGGDGRGGSQEVRAPALVGRLIAQRPRDFEATVRAGRGDMPSFGTSVSASQVADLFTWVARGE